MLLLAGATTSLELAADAAARDLIGRLGKTGAYTHDLGRYWVYRVLKERPELLTVVVRRYPYILIDEAQDIGSVHQAILQLLIDAGACVTLHRRPQPSEFTTSRAQTASS